MVLLCIYYAINKLQHYFIVIIHIVSMFYYAISTVFILHLLCKEKANRLVYLRAFQFAASKHCEQDEDAMQSLTPWSMWLVSNQRPVRPTRTALPTELHIENLAGV